MHRVPVEGTDEMEWVPDEVTKVLHVEPNPWFGRLAERNERIWRQSRYRTPWQIAVGEELSEARISQIIAEGTDFYDRLFTPRSHNEQTAAADRARSIPSRAVTG
jgi:hypothetical protein